MESQLEHEFQESYDAILNTSRRIGYITGFESQLDISSLSIEEVIAKSIADFEQEYYAKLRADAKLLLMINFVNMVYNPLTKTETRAASFVKREVYNEITSILKQANNLPGEISSHKILEAGLDMWSRLSLMSGSW